MPIGVLGDRLRPRSHKGTTVSTRVIARRPAILLTAAILLAPVSYTHLTLPTIYSV